MSQSKLLIRGSTLSAAHTFLQIGVSFLLTPYIISRLGDRLYGIWLVIAAFVGYYGLLDLGISGSVMRYLSRCIGSGTREEIKKYTSSAFIMLSVIGFAIILISLIVSTFASTFVSNAEDIELFRFIILFLGCTTGVTFPLRIFIGVLNSNLRFDLSRYIEIGEIIFRSGLILWLLLNGYGIYGIAISSSVAMIVDFIIKAIVAFKIDASISIRFKYFNIKFARKIFEYGAFNFIQDMANMLSSRIDPIVIAYSVGASSVTYYGVVLSLAVYFSQFFLSILGVMFPYYSQKEGARDLEALRVSFIFTSKICLIVSTFLTLMVILYSKQFLVRWLGPSFEASYPYAIILFWPMVFYFGYYSSGLVLNAIGKHRLVAGMEFMQGVLHLVLCVLLVKYYGLLGVAWSAALPMFLLGGIIKPLFACRAIDLDFGRYIIGTAQIPLKGLLVIIPVWFLIKRSVLSDYLSLSICFSIHLATFIVFGYFLLVSKEDIRKIKALVLSA